MAPAIEAFTTAARLAPSDALIAHSLARATLEGGLPAEALFERALRLAPNDASVLLGRSAAEVAEGAGSTTRSVIWIGCWPSIAAGSKATRPWRGCAG